MDEARALARLIASGPPLVYAAIKEIVREAEDMKFQDALNRITKSQFATVETLYRLRISWKARAPLPKKRSAGRGAGRRDRAHVWKGE